MVALYELFSSMLTSLVNYLLVCCVLIAVGHGTLNLSFFIIKPRRSRSVTVADPDI